MSTETLAYLLGVLAVGALAVVGTRGRFRPFTVTMGYLLVMAVGYWSLAAPDRHTEVAWLFLGAQLVIASGYLTASTLISRGRSTAGGRGDDESNPPAGALGIAVVVVGALIAYHFLADGIPVLSIDVEVARYSFTGSGLFGLPGRALLFGVVIVLVLAISRVREIPDPLRHGGALLWVTFALLVGSRLLTGFKSSLLEVVTILIFVGTMAFGAPSMGRAGFRLMIPTALALAFALFMAGNYSTLQGGGPSGLDYLWQRSTDIAAEPGYFVLSGGVLLPSGIENSLLNDLVYYVPKYVGMEPNSVSFPFVQVVSSWLYGTSLSVNSFIVPVTIGAFPSLAHDFGIWLGLLLYFAVGVLFCWLEGAAVRTRSNWRFAAAVVSLLGLTSYITKGDLIYNLLNWSAVFVFVWVVVSTGVVLTTRRSRAPTMDVRRAWPGAGQ